MSPLPAKMDTVVVEKCQAFCQALITGNHKFTFSLSIGKDKFNFETKELTRSSCEKKKKSPSQIRRETKRREERKQLKAPATEKVAERPVAKSCTLCNLSFNTEQGLKIHIGKTHKTADLPTPEKQRNHSTSTEASLVLSPGNESRCEELESSTSAYHKCRGCEKVFMVQDDLIEHEDNDHPLMCHICFKFFKDNKTKVMHFMENHNPNKKN